MSKQDQTPTDAGHPSDAEPVSKSERKRQMLRAQEVGESLIALTEAQLAQMPLDAGIVDAVLEAKRLQSREGLRRQKQFIGKLMRQADVDAVAAEVDALTSDQQLATAAFHEIETLRSALLSGGKSALGDVIGLYPDIDTQKLRQLVKRAQQEATGNQGGVAQRALFRFLRQAQEAKVLADQNPQW